MPDDVVRSDRGPESDPAPRWLTPAEQEAWKAVAGLLLLLPGLLDAQLQRDSGLSTFEYFVLSELTIARERTMRMSELAKMANGSLSRLSNVVRRLEQRGWVHRSPDPVDGRFTNATLTGAGWELVVQAAPGHVAAVRHYVLDPLTTRQIQSLRSIGQRILRQILDHQPTGVGG